MAEVFTADEPQSAGREEFDASSMAMIALFKYGAGMPFNRLEQLEKQLGIPLPASHSMGTCEAGHGGSGPC